MRRLISRMILFNVIFAVFLLLVPFGVNAGEWVDTDKPNCKIWCDACDASVTFSWSGKCVNGYASGSGTAIWYQNGKEFEHYEGQVEQGKSAGKGILTMGNDYKYEGDFVDGKFNGNGMLTDSNGRYFGDFVGGKMQGKGTFYYKDGSMFVGNFYNNGWAGGTLTDRNGKKLKF